MHEAAEAILNEISNYQSSVCFFTGKVNEVEILRYYTQRYSVLPPSKKKANLGRHVTSPRLSRFVVLGGTPSKLGCV